MRDYLISHQVDDVDLLIASHPDADHIGGCDEILEHYDVEQIIDNGMTAGTQTYQTYEDARDAEIADYSEAGFQHWDFGGVSFDVLGPVTPNFGDTNNNSVVTRLDTGDIDILLASVSATLTELMASCCAGRGW